MKCCTKETALRKEPHNLQLWVIFLLLGTLITIQEALKNLCERETKQSLNGSLHLAKFSIANIVQVLVQAIRKVKRSKIHIAQAKKF